MDAESPCQACGGNEDSLPKPCKFILHENCTFDVAGRILHALGVRF